MNATLTPSSTEQHAELRPRPRGARSPADRLQRPRLLAIRLFLLILGMAHFAFIPGTLIGDQRFGWDGHLGNLPLVMTWLH